jgi:hypothetical protein
MTALRTIAVLVGGIFTLPAAADPRTDGEVVITFDTVETGKPKASYTEQGVVFALSRKPTTSRAAGRVMFFSHLKTNKSGILNAMANESIPVEIRFPKPVSRVSLELWGSIGSKAVVEAFGPDDQVVDTATGAFTITKVPLGVTMWIKAGMDFGEGQVGVWKSVTLDKPDTLDVSLGFPTLGDDQVGTLVLHFRADSAAPTDSGSAQLILNQPENGWRFEAVPPIAGRDTVTTVKNLPAGGYQIRPYASVGEKKWWSAPMDSVHIVAGKTTTYVVRAMLR